MPKKSTKKTKNTSKKSAKLKKVAPYDICDRFCERCNYKSKCSVFKNSDASQMMRGIEGGGPENIKSVFSNLEASFKQIKAMMKKMAKEDKIDIEEMVVSAGQDKQFKIVELNIKKHVLHKKSQEFNKYADKFLKRFFIFSQMNNPFLLPALNKEINDLSFYFPLISDKIYLALSRLLNSSEKKSKSLHRDINCSACLALNASLVCEKAVASIMNETSELYIESMQFLTVLNDIRESILQTFPEAENFREEIIFNTRY